VLNMTGDVNDAAIVRSTIELAHNLGLQLDAEGVEDRETLELLTALGCDLAQGYHLAARCPPTRCRPPPPFGFLRGWRSPMTADGLNPRRFRPIGWT
jgi:EAL domain-containing protein (putative c-di-GMP-specific phosphodiesterase class I)